MNDLKNCPNQTLVREIVLSDSSVPIMSVILQGKHVLCIGGHCYNLEIVLLVIFVVLLLILSLVLMRKFYRSVKWKVTAKQRQLERDEVEFTPLEEIEF